MDKSKSSMFHTRLALALPEMPVNSARMSLVTGGMRLAEQRGYHVTITFLRSNGSQEDDLISAGRLADAVLPLVPLPDSVAKTLREEKIKVLPALVQPGQPFFNTYAVITGTISRLAVERMVQRGRKKLAYLCDDDPVVEILNQMRYAAMIQIAVEKGIKSPAMLKIKPGEPTLAGDLMEFFNENPDVNGFICHTDLLAIEVMQALRMLGKLVPADVAVIGVDDTPECSLVNPTLTSIGYDADKAVTWGGEAALATLDDEPFDPPSPDQIEDAFYIVARQSI